MAEAPVIRLEDLRKSYALGDVTVHALRGLDLRVDRREFVAVVGASGSGKSTLMNIVGLLDRPTSGRYFLEGEDVSGFDKDRRAGLRNRKIGFVFQNFNLLPRTTALENVELPLLYNGRAHSPGERHRQALSLLEAVGLGERAPHTPNQLSGGQQQRVAIARALVNDPEIVLADEPTGNLDSRNSRLILDLFSDLNRRRGQTIVMITHNPEAAQVGHRIIEMKDGEVVRRVATARAAAEVPA
jgi:putative ABC transport system ATP-binding protein